MFWLLASSIALGVLGGLRFKAPAMIAAGALVLAVGVAAGLAWWQSFSGFMALQLSYFATALLATKRR